MVKGLEFFIFYMNMIDSGEIPHVHIDEDSVEHDTKQIDQLVDALLENPKLQEDVFGKVLQKEELYDHLNGPEGFEDYQKIIRLIAEKKDNNT